MKNLLLFFFLFIGQSVLGQNFDLVIPNKVNYFKDFESFVHELRVDSLFVNGQDKEYYSFDRIRGIDSCYVTHSASIFGKVMIQNNNDWYIVNVDLDTIVIKSDALVNDSWICFDNLENQYIEASCVSLVNKNIDGNTIDFVKTIQFTLKDSTTNATISSPINSLELQISENNGIVKMIDFARFPFIKLNTSYYERFHYFEDFSNCQLILESIKDATYLRDEFKMSYYYNFEIGDIFQSKVSEEIGLIGGSSNGSAITDLTKFYMQYEVIDKQILPTKTNYTLNYKSLYIAQEYMGPGNFEEYDEGQIEIYVNNDSTIFYGNLFENDLNNFQNRHSVALKVGDRDELYFTRFEVIPVYNYLGGYNSCEIGIDNDYYYIQGVYGDFYLSEGHSNPNNYSKRTKELVYYKSGTEEWGTFVDLKLSELIEPESPSGIFIYPNPNNGSFTLFMEDYFDIIRVIITDASGREYYNERAFNEMDIIDLNLADGVYYLSINNGTMKDRKKFIVKN